jgi:hypothetical protein
MSNLKQEDEIKRKTKEIRKKELIIQLDKHIKDADKAILGIADIIGLLKQTNEYDDITIKITKKRFCELKTYMNHTEIIIEKDI